MATLPKQDYENYAKLLNKRDGQTVRYRWKVILRRARGMYCSPISLKFFLLINFFLLEAQKKPT